MAIKLAKNVKTVGASLYDGILSINIGEHNWLINVPVKQNYGYQLNEHNNPEVFCFLYNDETKLVIRRDGTGSLINKGNTCLIKNFVVEIPKELTNAVVVNGGSVVVAEVSKGSLATTCIIESKNIGILSVDDFSESIIFDIREASEYITDLSLQLGATYPVLVWSEGVCYRREDVNNPNSRVLYKVSGTVVLHQAQSIIE